MNKVTVRKAEKEDEIAVESVNKLAHVTLRKIYRPNKKALANRDKMISKFTSILAETENTVVGVLKYSIEEDRIHILDWSVHPDFRRKGIAKEMVQYLIRIGNDKNIERILLWTVKETGNVEIFSRMGFRVIKEEKSELFESEQYKFLTEVLLEYYLRQITHRSL